MAGGADEDAAQAALDLIREQLEAIAAMPGTRAKAAAIRDLATVLGELYAIASGIRTAEMLRIYDEEKLSLAPLAEVVGISKARAHQKIRERDRKRKEPDA